MARGTGIRGNRRVNTCLVDRHARIRRGVESGRRIVTKPHVGRRTPRPPPLLVPGALIPRRTPGHCYIRRMRRRTRSCRVRRILLYLLYGRRVPRGILVKVAASELGEAVRRRVSSGGRVRSGDVVDGNRRLGIGRQTFEGDRGDDAGGDGEAVVVDVVAHIDGLDGASLGVAR